MKALRVDVSRLHQGLFLATCALLLTHEVDSGFWREWDMMRLPGRRAGFLLANTSLAVLGLLGIVAMVQGIALLATRPRMQLHRYKNIHTVLDRRSRPGA